MNDNRDIKLTYTGAPASKDETVELLCQILYLLISKTDEGI